jgi:hypothetical protein
VKDHIPTYKACGGLGLVRRVYGKQYKRHRRVARRDAIKNWDLELDIYANGQTVIQKRGGLDQFVSRILKLFDEEYYIF